MNKKTLRPYVAIIAVVLFAVDIFWLPNVLVRWLGGGTSFVCEALLVVISVLLVLAFRGDLREVFPFRMPDGVKIAGTLVLWFGCFMTAMIVTLFVAWLFPEQMTKMLESGQMGLGESPFLLEFAMICITPAICEELSFRGVIMGSLKGIKNKWIVIAIVSVLFGAFHGSFLRFFPTALLGVGMGYLLFETGNMVYNMLFHMVNNMIPLIMLHLLNRFLQIEGMGQAVSAGSQSMEIGLMPLAVYMMYGAGVPLLIYMGNYLIHAGEPGYRRGLFPKEKTVSLTAVTASCFGLGAFGCLLFVFSMITLI